MDKKYSIILYPAEFLAVTARYKKNHIGDLIVAICEHHMFGKAIGPLPDEIKAGFELLQSGIDENNAKYAEIRAQKKANGLKGGRPKKANANHPVLEDKPKTTAPKTCNENDNGNENESVNVNDNDFKDGSGPPDVQPNKAGAPSVDEIVKYCQIRGVSVDPVKFIEFYNKRGWRAGKDYVALNWHKYVDDWDSRNRGLQPDDGPKPIGASLAKMLSKMEVPHDDHR